MAEQRSRILCIECLGGRPAKMLLRELGIVRSDDSKPAQDCGDWEGAVVSNTGSV